MYNIPRFTDNNPRKNVTAATPHQRRQSYLVLSCAANPRAVSQLGNTISNEFNALRQKLLTSQQRHSHAGADTTYFCLARHRHSLRSLREALCRSLDVEGSCWQISKLPGYQKGNTVNHLQHTSPAMAQDSLHQMIWSRLEAKAESARSGESALCSDWRAKRLT